MGCGTSTIKYLLFIFNLIFALGGLVILAIGAIIQWNIGYFETGLSEKVTVPAILLIIVGSIIFVTAFFGCCGAIRESHCMITTFAIIMLVVFLIQLIGGILAFVYQDELDLTLKNSMHDLMILYKKEGPDGDFARQYWDSIQSQFQCCGVDGPLDWTLKTPGVQLPPPSCSCDALLTSECVAGIYSKGCFPKLSEWMRMTQNVLGGVAIGLAVVELIGVIFALVLANAIKRSWSRYPRCSWCRRFYVTELRLCNNSYGYFLDNLLWMLRRSAGIKMSPSNRKESQKLYFLGFVNCEEGVTMCSFSIIKFLLFFFNCVIWIGGSALIVFGVILKVDNNVGLTEVNYGAIILIGIGGFIFCIAFLGCCGAIKESTCMLRTFGFILLIIFLIQMIGDILVFVYKEEVNFKIESKIQNSLQNYGKDGVQKTLWDTIQRELKCCGVNSSIDWTDIIPDSCDCVDKNIGNCTDDQQYYNEGCFKKLEEKFKSWSLVVSIVLLVLALIECLGAIFAFSLASQISSQHGKRIY
ncbi:uncharacterized protein LOC132192849 [Neocloeon triangulifer]|uniref:uncharacterized protein LOC132192849 n=1 Tax=Neocloeon triangulifer TaxID=2078957 RepID=UPI00286FAE5D|nr:uncharacterized protein LOC132192849 [Neocloeon triangulifer]